jgi:hypothetical protein
MAHPRWLALPLLCALVAGCSSSDGAGPAADGGGGEQGAGGESGSGGATPSSGGAKGSGGATPGSGGAKGRGGATGTGGGGPLPPLDDLPAAGNPAGKCAVPAGAGLEDVSSPRTVVGTGTPASCTSAAFVSAVAKGGVITFNCGPDPVTITLTQTAKIVNDTGPKIVIDGGGKVTLSGGGQRRILYQNTCDEAQKWTTSHCDSQDHPLLTVQNLTFVDGNAKSEEEGGGAIFARGGRLKIVNSRFFRNVCADEGPDVGGAAVRAFDQFDDQQLFVVGSTFGGREGLGNVGSNGGGVSSIGVSWTIVNSLFSHNSAIGCCGNPATGGTVGGGSGGAIYNDGDTMTLSLCGALIEENTVKAHGSAIFFVTNDHSGDIKITDSVIHNNHGGSWYALPGISMHDDTRNQVVGSTLAP